MESLGIKKYINLKFELEKIQIITKIKITSIIFFFRPNLTNRLLSSLLRSLTNVEDEVPNSFSES